MDKYVVATIHPFVLGQEVMVYIDSKCVQVLECTLEDICEKIYALCEQYDITKVNFIGGQLYSLKFKDQFVSNKFGKRNIEVHIQ